MPSWLVGITANVRRAIDALVEEKARQTGENPC
jgi:hypothetical protein